MTCTNPTSRGHDARGVPKPPGWRRLLPESRIPLLSKQQVQPHSQRSPFFFVINLTLHQFHHSNQKSPGHWRFPPSEAMDQSFQAIILSSFGLDQRIQRHPRCKFNDFNLIYAFGIIWQLSISSVLSGPGYADTFICFDPCLYSLPFHETPKT